MTAKPPEVEELLAILHKKSPHPNEEFTQLLQKLYSHEFGVNGPESDAAFFELMRRSDEFFTELVTILEPLSSEMAQRGDGSSNWYYLAVLECISCASNPKALSVLWRELQSPGAKVRMIAIKLLGELARRNPEAWKILRNARHYEFASPQETAEFREAIEKALKDH